MSRPRPRYPWKADGNAKQRRALGVFVNGRLVIYRSLPPNVVVGWSSPLGQEPGGSR